MRQRARVVAVGVILVGCGGGGQVTSGDLAVVTTVDAATPDLASSGGCALTAATTATTTVTGGCTLLTRDASACAAARTAQGLGGAWLKFSCRVTLTDMSGASTPYVQAATDSRPDYRSNFFATTDACYVAYTPPSPNPNMIAVQNLSLKIPKTPGSAGDTMGLGAIGVAVNGVAIFNNQAAPNDDIFKEALTFDQCQGHPAPGNLYHYHSEPYAISVDDANLIGVLRDGYFLYGRRDADGSLPTTLDAHGGHIGTTADSTVPIFHYHVNEQTSTTAGTAGEKQWFLTTGIYRGSPLN